MFLFLITICAFLAPALSKPQAAPAAPAAESTPIPIVSQTEEINPNGSFKFSYETGNGIKVEESGYLKDGAESSTDKIQVIEGSVSYTDNEGKVINLKYVADENGFQPEGDHLPTAPPLPGAIANALKAAPEVEPSKPAAPPAAPPAAQPAVQPVAQPAPQEVKAEAKPEETAETKSP